MDNSHFLELRKRLTLFLIGYALIAIICIIFAHTIFDWLSYYQLPKSTTLITTEVASPFLVPLQLALTLAFYLSFPWFALQCWWYIKPALYEHEKRVVRALLGLGVCLFYSGSFFALNVVCPLTLRFFSSIAPSSMQVMIDSHHYFSFLLKMVLVFGLSFQIPIIISLCLQMQLLKAQTLKKHRAWVLVLAFIFGMLLTPPDVISQCLLAIPLLILFELGLYLHQWLPSLASSPSDTSHE